MPAYLERCTSDLMDLTELVRGRLSSQERLTLGALITIDVHARDVVAELADANVKNVSWGRTGVAAMDKQPVAWRMRAYAYCWVYLCRCVPPPMSPV